ncbi:ABC transporter permease [Desulfurococcus amylolyticus]|uniref:ABC transporter permease n=1 Tax=Desulfurococcus amylolyticus TaxID=94694 RepID=UPI0023EFF676|nr:ABC transporter permease [Desulfurococcus amylolyticus]
MEAIYKLLVKIIDSYASLRDKINKGWKEKNSSRIREWKLMAYAFSKSKIGVLGGILVFIEVVLAIVGPIIAWEPYWVYPVINNPDLKLLPPCIPPWCTGSPLLGTDEWGRDLLSITLVGVRISFIISILVVLFGAPLGIILGLVAGYKGGVIDEIIMRLTDIFMAFPALVLAIAFAAVLPERLRLLLESNTMLRDFLAALLGLRVNEYPQIASLLAVWIAMILVWWPGYARIVRGSVLSAKEQTFVEAAKVLGLSTRRILFKHILPNIISPIIVMMTFDIATAALFAATLSFLGLGPQEPVPELGFIISKAGNWFPHRSYHIVTFVGIVLLIIALGWNLLGDALRDILDPRTRRAIEFTEGGEKK